MNIELINPGETVSKECEVLLRALPDWFGLEHAIVQYEEEIKTMPTFVVRDDENKLIGFMSLNRHFPTAAEVHVMAIAKEHHRKGIGRQLIETGEDYLKQDGCNFLQVKTLSPTREDTNYAKTRLFYEGMGFQPLQEFPTLWDEANPCLMLVKSL